MKIINERERQKNQRQRETKKWVKLGFVQIICKASLIFKSNLELYKKENYTSQSMLRWGVDV